MSLLEDLFRNGALRTLDHALAQGLRRLDASASLATPDAVLAGAALASFAVGQGHAAFDPARPHALVDTPAAWPAATEWQDLLAASRWVARPDAPEAPAAPAPLVLEHGLLYLRRYREYERRLALGLRRLAAHAPPACDAAELAPLFAALFPHARDGDRQARAAALALVRSLLLITGGPGTGKTTTVARLLLLLVAQARQAGATPPRIALAAPTGRAAERMAASLRAAIAVLRATPVEPALCDVLPTGASTLHRLLGTLPDRPRFRHDALHPLAVDVVVVDEASMVDLPLMCKLVEAVPDGARLVLLGDRDQLPSVEAGDVLAAMGDAAGSGEALPADVAGLLAPLLGSVDAGASAPARGALAGHRVQLRRGYRQAETLDLAPLATATRDGDADAALALLQPGASAGVHFHEGLADPLVAATREELLAPWRALQDLTDPVEALAQAARQRVLTAVRDGPQGARLLNARIEEAIAGAHRAAYFHGRLLLVTENSYRHGLFNGDIGVCLRGADGSTMAWFPGDDGPRPFHPAALPAHAGAFAMTVHKAQGSEFDTVWLLLPRQDARVLSRELVYTALTRARRALHVAAEPAVLRLALARRTTRVSGLAARLASA
jgi:exodeoxyribonuclease V alpha subunit